MTCFERVSLRKPFVVGEAVGELVVGDIVGDTVGEDVVGDIVGALVVGDVVGDTCLLYTSPSPRDVEESRMPSSA